MDITKNIKIVLITNYLSIHLISLDFIKYNMIKFDRKEGIIIKMKIIEEKIYNIEKSDIKKIFKTRNPESNKGDFGYVGILGGCENYSGAIKLANMSATALRAGCGVIRLIIPKSIENFVAPYLLEQIMFTLDSDKDGKMIFNENRIKEGLNKLKALAIGMGWGIGNDNEKILKYIIENYNIPLVIDADGINCLAKMGSNILKNAKGKIILTPHLKEFERISKIKIEEVKLNPIKYAKKFAKENNIIVLLKGHTTIITDGEETYLVEKGCAGMATAGSGDVLSGILVGLLGYNEPNILTIASGAYLAGTAGEIAQEKYTDISMKSSDTIECIPEAIKLIREK